jgi:class 3 adenylate cyclase
MAPASHSVLHLDAVRGGPGKIEVDLMDGQAIPARARVAAGPVTLHLRCRMPRGAGLLLFPDPAPPPEERRPGMPAPSHDLRPFLTGKRLLTAQAFRDLFSAQSIPSEGGLELKSLTVLFTDLKSSTEMYERIGDLQAFGLVRRHFSSLREAVAVEGGAVVKTIGDAIMASFPEPRSALRAAAAMDREVAALEGGLALKIGLHAGPCIAVELNDRLDYFGRTVNMAARVQGLAGEREIVCTDAVWEAPGVVEAGREAGLSHRRDQAVLKGFRGAIPVVRLHV